MTYQSINPNDGKTLKTSKEPTDRPLETAFNTAGIYFEPHPGTFVERVFVATTAASIMSAPVDAFGPGLIAEDLVDLLPGVLRRLNVGV